MYFRFIAAVMFVLMIISCGVQYNDPDPWLWIAAYGAAALLTIPPMFGRDTILPAIAGLIFAVWGALLLREYLADPEHGPFLETEIAREGGGLLFTFTWMAVLTARWFWLRNRVDAAPTGEE